MQLHLVQTRLKDSYFRKINYLIKKRKSTESQVLRSIVEQYIDELARKESEAA